MLLDVMKTSTIPTSIHRTRFSTVPAPLEASSSSKPSLSSGKEGTLFRLAGFEIQGEDVAAIRRRHDENAITSEEELPVAVVEAAMEEREREQR